MREEHPIDNHFREALLGAEVQPPASVWEGVKNRRRRRGMAFWSRRRGLTIVTLFLALGAGAYWALYVDRERAHDIGQPSASTATHVSSSVTSTPMEAAVTAPNTGTPTLLPSASIPE